MIEWSKIITESAMMYIDDIRLQQQLEANPALFLRKMSLYLKAALPLLNRPVELQTYLLDGMTEATFDSYEWTSTYESISEETVLTTGKVGFELCSASIYSEDGTKLTPYYDFTYDSETGDITMPPQGDDGIKYDFEFYKDGSFSDFSYSVMRLFGLAISIVWYERFTNNWLNMQPKIKDASFETINESNYMDKMTARMIAQRQAFNDELNRYEQERAYQYTVRNDRGIF